VPGWPAPGGKVPVGGERGEARGQILADDGWQDKDKSEEAEAVECRDGAMRFDLVHRFEFGQEVGAEAKQPPNMTQNEMQSEDGFWQHLGLHPTRLRPGESPIPETRPIANSPCVGHCSAPGFSAFSGIKGPTGMYW